MGDKQFIFDLQLYGFNDFILQLLIITKQNHFDNTLFYNTLIACNKWDLIYSKRCLNKWNISVECILFLTIEEAEQYSTRITEICLMYYCQAESRSLRQKLFCAYAMIFFG